MLVGMGWKTFYSRRVTRPGRVLSMFWVASGSVEVVLSNNALGDDFDEFLQA